VTLHSKVLLQNSLVSGRKLRCNVYNVAITMEMLVVGIVSVTKQYILVSVNDRRKL